MLETVSKIIQRWSAEGMRWPFLHDPTREEPSVTLMFFYITFLMASISVSVSSVLLLLHNDPFKATIMPIMMFTLGFIFYRLRSLDNVKIDLNDQELELSSDNDAPKEKEDNDHQN